MMAPHATPPLVPAVAEMPSERSDGAVGPPPAPLIDASFKWMRFPAPLERQFLQDGADQRLRYVGISGVLSLFIFNVFLPVDYLMAHDVFGLALKLRLGVFTPGAMVLLLFPWLARDWTLRHIQPLMLEAIVLATGVSAAGVVAIIMAASHSHLIQYYHVGLVIVVTYGNVVQRLRFWYAVVFSLAVYTIHIGGVVMVPSFNQRVILPVVSLMGATMVFTLMANYALEYDERKRYLLSLRRKQLLGEVGQAHERLKAIAQLDALTGLYNRRHFDQCLLQLWQRAQHDGDDMAVIMMDVDHFKKYNDHYSHLQGDECLIAVAQALSASLRSHVDIVARYGGEEFIAVLPKADAAMASQAAERIREAVQVLQMAHEASNTADVVTVSLGVASCQARAGQPAMFLVAAADAALYEAKQAGRNRSVLAPSS